MTKTNQDSFSWAELAELTHETQTKIFGWCSCEDNEGLENPFTDCPKAENPKGYRAHFTGAWICYICGALCDCGGEE